MNVHQADFIKSAAKPKDYPPPGLPEVAFVGRSNVGKSSLINVLAGRKGLVRTSSTPGRTQLINFFDINGILTLVDLPGYGYAKAPPELRKQWGPMIETYLASTGEPQSGGADSGHPARTIRRRPADAALAGELQHPADHRADQMRQAFEK